MGMRTWLLKADTHWTVERIHYVHHGDDLLFAPGLQALCLMKALEGECTILCDGTRFRLTGSRMLLVDMHRECRLPESSSDLRLEVIQIATAPGRLIGETPAQLCEQFPEFRRFCYGETAPLVFDDTYALIVPFLKNIRTFETFAPAAESAQLIHLYIAYILLVIVCEVEEEKRFSFTGNRHVRKALRYIQQHYMHNITALEIAEHVGIHPRHLHRVFAGEMHMSINEYLLQTRLSRIEFLLIHTDFPITEIARLTGISSQQYLSKLFREHKGITPAALRRTYNITCVYDFNYDMTLWEDPL